MTPPAQVTAGVIIRQVHPGSAAATAGLMNDDRILSINGVRADNVVDALVVLASAKAGDALHLSILRGGDRGVRGSNRMEISIPVTKAPPAPPNQLLLGRLGVEAATVTPVMMKKLHLAVSHGVLLNAVKPDSAAAEAGLLPGDILYQLGPWYVNSVEDVEMVLKNVPGEVEVRVGVVRSNSRARDR